MYTKSFNQVIKMIKILENLPTYLTMPYPRLAMITRILARVLFTAESTSANATAPGTAGGHRVSLRPPPSASHMDPCVFTPHPRLHSPDRPS